MNLAILGFGTFGRSLSFLWRNNFSEISVYQEGVARERSDSTYDNVIVRTDLVDTINNSDVIIISASSTSIHGLAQQIIYYADQIIKDKVFVLTSKGLDRATKNTLNSFFISTIPWIRTGVLSGPTFSYDILKGLPVYANIGAQDECMVDFLYDALRVDGKLILQKTNCVAEAELLGATKNIAAILSGMIEGGGFGISARGGMLAKLYSELVKVMNVLSPISIDTFLSYAGLGDIFSTCFSTGSRNFNVGKMIASGQKVRDVLLSIGHVAEGVQSLLVVKELADDCELEVPIIQAMYNIVFNNGSFNEFVERLVLK